MCFHTPNFACFEMPTIVTSVFRCPFYKYSACSLSNIMSSWFQYEALKFVSFPTQVLAKACKIIPVMLMGKVISKNKYPLFDWVTAAQLGVGTSIFLLSNDERKQFGN